jgi:hypothetical protein
MHVELATTARTAAAGSVQTESRCPMCRLHRVTLAASGSNVPATQLVQPAAQPAATAAGPLQPLGAWLNLDLSAPFFLLARAFASATAVAAADCALGFAFALAAAKRRFASSASTCTASAASSSVSGFAGSALATAAPPALS